MKKDKLAEDAALLRALQRKRGTAMTGGKLSLRAQAKQSIMFNGLCSGKKISP